MMKPKEALIKDGTIPTTMGRGRLSLAQDARCRFLAAQGWDIQGYTVKAAAPVKAGKVNPAAPIVEKTKAVNEKVILDFTYRYDEDLWTAVDESGKVWGMREVCNKCRVSLVQNTCNEPTILGDIRVTITPRGGP